MDHINRKNVLITLDDHGCFQLKRPRLCFRRIQHDSRLQAHTRLAHKDHVVVQQSVYLRATIVALREVTGLRGLL